MLIPELIVVTASISNIGGFTFRCSGGGPLGHPKIYIKLERSTLEDPVPCNYCGLRFVNKDQITETLKAGKQVAQGKDFILPHQVAEYVFGGKEDEGHH